MDSIFSGKNNTLIEINCENPFECVLHYVINSQAELNEINPFDFEVNCVDFTKYTLIGGYFTVSGLYPIMDITLTDKESVYDLNIHLDYSNGGFDAIGRMYFWRVFPKLKKGREVIPEITNKY